jgi:hypothetical protein
MKLPNTFAAALLLLTNFCFSQVFQRTYESSGFSDIAVTRPTSDGGYIIGGNTAGSQFGPTKAMVLKTDASGDITWSFLLSGGMSEAVADIIPTQDGNFVGVGTTFSFNAAPYGNVLLFKFTPNGTVLWTKMYGGPDYDYGHRIKQTTDGGFVIAGLSSSFGAGGYDLYVLKTDSAGTAQWSTTIGGPSNDEAQQVFPTADGGCMLIGSSSSYSPNMIPYYEFAMCKLMANGTLSWMKKIGVGGYCLCYDAVNTADGGYLMTGWTDGFGQGSNEVLLIKADSSGNGIWAKTYGGDSLDIAQRMIQRPNGELVIAGMTKSFGSGNYDGYVINTDAQGSVLWSAVYGGAASDQFYGINATNDGGFITSGYTHSFASGNKDAYVVKCDVAGSSGCFQDDPLTVTGTPTPITTTVTPVTIQLWNTIPVAPTITTGATTALLCLTSSISDVIENKDVTAYPNPGNDIIQLQSEHIINRVTLYDLGGRVVRDFTINATTYSMPTSSLNRGTYVLRLLTEYGWQTQRIVLQ